MNSRNIEKFKEDIWQYYKKYKRDFPWRRTHDPYKILVSEIMLQQTQIGRVETKYPEFLRQFPNFRALARAQLRDVLRAWSGLGYNRRALALKKTAEIVMERYGGKLPRNEEELIALPGIGPATAGAIRAFAFNLPSVFIETNIRRVFIHFFFPRKKKISDQEILKLIEKSLPARLANAPAKRAGRQVCEWYWALMDYGSMLLTTSGSALGGFRSVGVSANRSKKMENPNRKSAHYTKQSKFEGSTRQLRGQILKILLHKKSSVRELARKTKRSLAEVKTIMTALRREGLI